MQLNSFTTEVAPTDAWHLLSPKMSPQRRSKLEAVAAARSAYLRLVLQDVHDPHNIGACLRSAEAFGVQHVDLINVQQKFGKPSSVARGARYWLDMHRFNSIPTYLAALREAGYALAAAYPAQDAVRVDEIPIDRPLAIVFGNEHAGLHPDWNAHIDYRFTIPMYGMVESFNISVSVALTLFTLQERCRKDLAPARFFLPAAERLALLNRWACQQSQDAPRELERLRALLQQEGGSGSS